MLKERTLKVNIGEGKRSSVVKKLDLKLLADKIKL